MRDVDRIAAPLFVYAGQNDPRVPDHVRRKMSAVGLHKREFGDTGNWPWQIYVRQGRRIEGRAIVVTTGFKPFDAKRIARYGYGKLPHVYTSLEVERLVNASGPTGGDVVLRDGRRPKSVGIIHCVGSRDVGTNRWCSRVCCMYSLKLAHLLKEHTDAEVFNFYIDMRTPGKGFEEFYQKLLNEGVHFIRGRVAEVTDWALASEEEGKLVIRVRL